MGLSFRMFRRSSSHRILGMLYTDYLEHAHGDKAIHFVPKTSLIPNKVITDLTLESCFRDLIRNGFANTNKDLNSSDPEFYNALRITLEGIEAYRDDHYDSENQKDLIIVTEFWTKWIIPVVSFILSVGAVIISIIVLVHTWNKK